MNLHFLPLKELSETQREALARLHFQVMDGLLTDFGLPLVRRYYQAASLQPEVIGLAAFDSAGSLLGWALGSPNPGRLNASLSRLLLGKALLRPALLLQMVSSAWFALFNPWQLPPGSVELTYLGVAPSARGKGLGKALLGEFLAAAHCPVWLSVETDNLPALSLYQQLGFELRHTFWEGSYHRHRMERKTIAP